MDGGRRATGEEATSAQPGRGFLQRLRARYRDSFVQDLLARLAEAEFGDRIIVFGASLLLSVLPLIIVLSVYANHRIQDDIAQHLGLSRNGVRVVEGLFRSSITSFNLAVLISLVLSFSGTVMVARTVQSMYEQVFRQAHARSLRNYLRSVAWVLVVGGVVIGDGAVGKVLRDGPGGPAVMGALEFVGFFVFFWWSIHFLLGGRLGWKAVLPSAVTTALFWIGLGIFATFYFSSTIVSDSKTYGTIGVTFTLVAWFIAMGAVVILGAMVGEVWREWRSRAKVGPSSGA